MVSMAFGHDLIRISLTLMFAWKNMALGTENSQSLHFPYCTRQDAWGGVPFGWVRHDWVMLGHAFHS
jgi:hypothetical protein